eukprot:evm.model.NODE_42378_length_25727_cov_25.663311.4
MAARLTAVTLMGTASEGFRIMAAHIVSLPTHGHLYRLNDTNATTPLLVGDKTVVSPLGQAQVAYLYTGPQVLVLQVNTPLVPENTLVPVYLYGVDYQSLEHRELCFDITAQSDLERLGSFSARWF